MASEPRVAVAGREAVAELTESAPEEVRTLFDHAIESMANIPWIDADAIDWEGEDMPGVLALVPELFVASYLEEYHTHPGGRVDTATKELMAAAVSDRLGCRACAPTHAGAARAHGAPEDVIDAVREFDERKDELPDDIRAVIEFGLAVAYDPHGVTDADFDALREAGYTDPEIVELAQCALVSYKNSAFNVAFDISQ